MSGLFNIARESMANASFNNEVKGIMNDTFGKNKNEVMDALSSVDLSSLSKTERTAILTTLKEMAGDHYIRKQDAGTLSEMIKSFGEEHPIFTLFGQGFGDKAGFKLGGSSIENAAKNPASFDKAADKALDKAEGWNSAMVECALSAVDSASLSIKERSAILTTLKSFTGDAQLSGSETRAILDMISQFDDKGKGCINNFWPFPQINCDKMQGNPLLNCIMGIAAGGCYQPSPGGCFPSPDAIFSNRIEGMLDNCQPSFNRDALSGAFQNADLSKLDSGERQELMSMVSLATCDGRISRCEAHAIYDALQQAQQPDCPCPHFPNPVETNNWSVQQDGSKAEIDLGSHTLSLNEKHSEIWITNKETGEKSRIWGDPHFDVDGDGKTDMDFWGTLTLNLEGGTKITINTTPYAKNEKMTLSSQLTITNGNDSIVVKGLDQNKIGDMSIEQGKAGTLLDTFTGDGLSLYENTEGKGWMVMDGLNLREVTQQDLNATKGAQSDFSIAEGLKAMFTLNIFASMPLLSLLNGMFGDQN
ncbi:hypothetical protein BTA51_05265 [Hahella sp. CCB-MM4]|uniref:DUF1521 domain-containing protein n=1 Tax=Hahella sp. (strain CCB-MM4) TaxID=1926491 RepID=UPI000B9AC7B6|nr:DUF1521 domain-containing protein [Hahella sp. CCB-MM4]OZG74419.1 hypothetical protein BTA51_05265 [Hahella sp. CCB-MM4]